MGDVKYAYYETASGYKVTGKTNNDIVLAGGGTMTVASLALSSNTVTLNSAQTITAQKTFDVTPLFKNVGNLYYNSAIEVRGNGSTVAPSIGFHQPGLYAGVIKLSNGIFEFKTQDNSGNIGVKASGFVIEGLSSNHILRADGTAITELNGGFAINTWNQSSLAVTNNPSIPNQTMHPTFGQTDLQNATYGSIMGMINAVGPGVGNPTRNRYHRIKMLHNDSSGYYTEIAVNMTGTPSMYYKQFAGGSSVGWLKVHDTTTITTADISNWNGTQTWVNTNFIPKSHPVYNVTVAQINKWNKTEPKEYVVDPTSLTVTVDDESDRITVVGYEFDDQEVVVGHLYARQYYTFINLSSANPMTVKFPTLSSYIIDASSKVTFYISDSGDAILMDKSAAEIWV